MNTNDMDKTHDLESDFDQALLEPMVAEHDLLDWLTQEPAGEQTGHDAHRQTMHSAVQDRAEATG